MQFFASERFATSESHLYQANLPIAVGPDPTDLFVAGDGDASRVRRLNPDGTNEILASHVHVNPVVYYGVIARRGSIRHGLGETAWITVEAWGTGRRIFGYTYADGQIQQSPGLATTIPYNNVRIFSDGSELAYIAFEQPTNTIQFLPVTWDGNPANAPTVGTAVVFNDFESLSFSIDIEVIDGVITMFYGNSITPKTKRVRRHPFPYDTVLSDDLVPTSYGFMGFGYLTGIPDTIEIATIEEPGTVWAALPALPDASGFGSYLDQGLVRTHEWDEGLVITWGAGEFSNSGEFVPGSGDNLYGSHMIAYLNGEPAFNHQISGSDGFFYSQNFMVNRPLRIGRQVWGLTCYDDYAGGAANDDSFIQAFGYELPEPPVPVLALSKRSQRAQFSRPRR